MDPLARRVSGPSRRAVVVAGSAPRSAVTVRRGRLSLAQVALPLGSLLLCVFVFKVDVLASLKSECFQTLAGSEASELRKFITVDTVVVLPPSRATWILGARVRVSLHHVLLCVHSFPQHLSPCGV